MPVREKEKAKQSKPGRKRPAPKASARRSAGGVVAGIVRPSEEGTEQLSPEKLLARLRVGLPFGEFDQLKEALDLSGGEMAAFLGTSRTTLQRRKAKQRRLSESESDRLLRYARLMGKAVAVFESREAAREWLKSPQKGLAGNSPLEYARSELGAREVEALLGRIDQGVYT